jgi:hypothetical protein
MLFIKSYLSSSLCVITVHCSDPKIHENLEIFFIQYRYAAIAIKQLQKRFLIYRYQYRTYKLATAAQTSSDADPDPVVSWPVLFGSGSGRLEPDPDPGLNELLIC